VVALEALGWLVDSGKGWFPGWLVGAGNHAVASAVRQADCSAAARAIESSVSRFPENTRSTVIGLAGFGWCLVRLAARWPVIGMSTLSWIDQALDNLILAQILRCQRPGMCTKYRQYTADFWELYTDLLPAFFARGSCPAAPYQKVAQTRESRKAHEAGAHGTGGGSRAIPRSAREREKAGTNSQKSAPYRMLYTNTRLAQILKSQRPSIYIGHSIGR
jgi:hypothetical protein